MMSTILWKNTTLINSYNIFLLSFICKYVSTFFYITSVWPNFSTTNNSILNLWRFCLCTVLKPFEDSFFLHCMLLMMMLKLNCIFNITVTVLLLIFCLYTNKNIDNLLHYYYDDRFINPQFINPDFRNSIRYTIISHGY